MMDIYTARVNYDGDDRLDITRMGRHPVGIALAPSWAALGPYLAKRKDGDLDLADWQAYRGLYLDEMRFSYRRNRIHWEQILAMPVVTLVCFCVDPMRCHRTIAAEILCLVAGPDRAAFRGERKPIQGSLFDKKPA